MDVCYVPLVKLGENGDNNTTTKYFEEVRVEVKIEGIYFYLISNTDLTMVLKMWGRTGQGGFAKQNEIN